MTIYLNFAELNSIASLGAIAPDPVSDLVVLTHVKVEIAGQQLTAYATDRYLAARVEFTLVHEREGDGLVEFTVSAETLKRALAVAKRAAPANRRHGVSLVHLEVGPADGYVSLTVDGDLFRSHPPIAPGADRISTYPSINRLFPESDEHVNDIGAGATIDLEILTKAAKLRHPDDVLSGRYKTTFGAYRVSLSKPRVEWDPGKGAPWFLTRREGGITVIAQPMLATAVNSKDPGAL